MPCTLYYFPEGPPSRAVLLLIRYLNLTDIELKLCSPISGETKDPEFVKMNPQHTVPFLNDNGYHLAESRAIMIYLIQSRAPECPLLGRFPKKSGLIHHRMHYEMSALAPVAVMTIRAVLLGNTTVISPAVKENLDNVFTILDGFLEKSAYFADNTVTIADFSYLAMIASFVHCGLQLEEKYPHIWAWYKKCSALPGFEENEEGAKSLGTFFKSKITEGF